MSRAIYLGHFDPPTLLHGDIVARGARLFDELVIGVWQPPLPRPLLPFDERLALAHQLWAAANVSVQPASGSAATMWEATGSDVELVALRGVGDWEAALEESLHPRTHLIVAAEYLPLTSALVREIVRLGGDVLPFVSPVVLEHLEYVAQT